MHENRKKGSFLAAAMAPKTMGDQWRKMEGD